MPPTPPVTVTLYCECGASITIWQDNADCYEETFTTWMKHHQGDGHGPADAEIAKRRIGSGSTIRAMVEGGYG